LNAGARELLAWLRAASVYGDFERFFLPLLRDADAMAWMRAYARKVARAAAEDAKLRVDRERQQDNLEGETIADDSAQHAKLSFKIQMNNCDADTFESEAPLVPRPRAAGRRRVHQRVSQLSSQIASRPSESVHHHRRRRPRSSSARAT